MTLKPAIYTPSGRRWWRLRDMFKTAYFNVRIRYTEAVDPGFYVQLERLERK